MEAGTLTPTLTKPSQKPKSTPHPKPNLWTNLYPITSYRNGSGLVNTPIGVLPRPNRFANQLLELVDGFTATYTATEAPPFDVEKDWNVLMHGVAKIAVELNMGCVVRPIIEFGAALSWGTKSFRARILAAGGYDYTRKLFGAEVHNKHEVLLWAVAVPTSFALARRHFTRDSDADAALSEALQEPSSLLATIMPFACGSVDIDQGIAMRVLEAILAGGAVHESATWFSVWKQLQANACCLVWGGKSKGLFWKEEGKWVPNQPLCIYGGFFCKGNDGGNAGGNADEKDYLLRLPDTSGWYVCGKMWMHMPNTHLGGCANHSDQPSTEVRWVPVEQLLPKTILESPRMAERRMCQEWDAADLSLAEMQIPVVFSAPHSGKPRRGEELTVWYARGFQAGNTLQSWNPLRAHLISPGTLSLAVPRAQTILAIINSTSISSSSCHTSRRPPERPMRRSHELRGEGRLCESAGGSHVGQSSFPLYVPVLRA